MTASRSWRASDTLRLLNTLFVLNAVGAGVIALVMAGSRQVVAVLGALAAFVEFAAVFALAAFVLARRRESVGR